MVFERAVINGGYKGFALVSVNQYFVALSVVFSEQQIYNPVALTPNSFASILVNPYIRQINLWIFNP